MQSEASYDVSDEIVLSAFNDHLYLIEADYPSHQEVILVRLLYEGN